MTLCTFGDESDLYVYGSNERGWTVVWGNEKAEYASVKEPLHGLRNKVDYIEKKGYLVPEHFKKILNNLIVDQAVAYREASGDIPYLK